MYIQIVYCHWIEHVGVIVLVQPNRITGDEFPLNLNGTIVYIRINKQGSSKVIRCIYLKITQDYGSYLLQYNLVL